MRQKVVYIREEAVQQIKQKLKVQRDAQEQTSGGDDSSVYELLVLFLAEFPSNTERNKLYRYTAFMLTLEFLSSTGCGASYYATLQSFNRFWELKTVEICSSLDADDQDRALSLSTREFTSKIKEQAVYTLEKFWFQTNTDIMIATMYPDAKYILQTLLSHNKKDSDYIKNYLSIYDERFGNCLSGSGSLLHESRGIAIRLACGDTLEQLMAVVEANTIKPVVDAYFHHYVLNHGRMQPCFDGNLVHFANQAEALAEEHLQLQAKVHWEDEHAHEGVTNIPITWSAHDELSAFLDSHDTPTLKKGEFPAMELQKIVLRKLKNISDDARHLKLAYLETASKLKTLLNMLNITVKTSEETNLDEVLAWKWTEECDDACLPELVANTESGLNDIATVLTAISLSRYSYSFFDPNNPIIEELDDRTKQAIWDPFFKQLSATVTQLQKNIRGKAARRIVNSLQEKRHHQQQHPEYLDQARNELVDLYCNKFSEKEVTDSLDFTLTNKMDDIFNKDFFEDLELELSYRPIQCQKLCAAFQKHEKMSKLETCKRFLKRNSLAVEEEQWEAAKRNLQDDGDVWIPSEESDEQEENSKFFIKMGEDIYFFDMSLRTTQFNKRVFLAMNSEGNYFVLKGLAKPHKESETALLDKSVQVYAKCKELHLYMKLVNYGGPHIKQALTDCSNNPRRMDAIEQTTMPKILKDTLLTARDFNTAVRIRDALQLTYGDYKGAEWEDADIYVLSKLNINIAGEPLSLSNVVRVEVLGEEMIHARIGAVMEEYVRRSACTRRELHSEIYTAPGEKTNSGLSPLTPMAQAAPSPRDRGDGPVDQLGLVIKVTDAVNNLHSQRIIHRNLKPQGILISGGKVHFSDAEFVLNGLLDGTAVPLVATTVRAGGTPQTRAPEHRGKRNRFVYDRKSDVYSLGMTLKLCKVSFATLELMLAEEPSHRPDLDLVKYSLMAEKSLIEGRTITDEQQEIINILTTSKLNFLFIRCYDMLKQIESPVSPARLSKLLESIKELTSHLKNMFYLEQPGQLFSQLVCQYLSGQMSITGLKKILLYIIDKPSIKDEFRSSVKLALKSLQEIVPHEPNGSSSDVELQLQELNKLIEKCKGKPETCDDLINVYQDRRTLLELKLAIENACIESLIDADRSHSDDSSIGLFPNLSSLIWEPSTMEELQTNINRMLINAQMYATVSKCFMLVKLRCELEKYNSKASTTEDVVTFSELINNFWLQVLKGKLVHASQTTLEQPLPQEVTWLCKEIDGATSFPELCKITDDFSYLSTFDGSSNLLNIYNALKSILSKNKDQPEIPSEILTQMSPGGGSGHGDELAETLVATLMKESDEETQVDELPPFHMGLFPHYSSEPCPKLIKIMKHYKTIISDKDSSLIMIYPGSSEDLTAYLMEDGKITPQYKDKILNEVFTRLGLVGNPSNKFLKHIFNAKWLIVTCKRAGTSTSYHTLTLQIEGDTKHLTNLSSIGKDDPTLFFSDRDPLTKKNFIDDADYIFSREIARFMEEKKEPEKKEPEKKEPEKKRNASNSCIL